MNNYTQEEKEMMSTMLNDVITHFSQNPEELRSVKDNGYCTYHPPKYKPKSIGCAIGIYIPWKTSKEMDISELNLSEMCDREKFLPRWMFKIPKYFLNAIQQLHDDQINWNTIGLTVKGKRRVKQIKSDFKLK